MLSAAATILLTEQYLHAGDWAGKNRRLTRSESSEPGLFNIARTPYFVPIYEAAEGGKYRWIVVVCGSQMGKTEFLLNRTGYRLDTNPCPLMIVQPNKDLAKRFSKSRVRKMVDNTPVLWEKLSKGVMDNIFEKYIGGCQLKIAWATSSSQLCSDPAGEVHMDEVDRMPRDVDNEGDPVLLSDARGSNSPDFILFAYSTPTIEGNSPIMTLCAMGTELLFCAPCTQCGHFFAPWLKDLWYPKNASSGRAKKEARIICPDCEKPLDDSWRKFALQPGVGQYIGPEQKVIDGKVVGPVKETSVASFRIPGLFSAWVSIGESAEKWINANNDQDNAVASVKTVINTRFGELYHVKGDAPRLEEMEPLKAEPDSPELPGWTLLLTAGVDVQKRGVYVVLRAWGPHGKSQKVLFTFLAGDTNEDQVWKDLESKILNYPFVTKEKNPRIVFVVKMAIDRRYREEMVDVFVSDHKDKCVGALGQFKQIVPVRLTTIDVTYEGRKKISGIQVLSLADDHFKQKVYNRITRGPNVDDAWLISQDSTEEYCLQVLSEELITLPSGKTIWKKRRKDNHALDAEKINLALAHWLNFRLLKAPEKPGALKKRSVSQARELQGV